MHRVLPPLSKGWAYGGAAGSRKEEVDSQGQQEENKAVEGKAPEHRMLPPLSKGWAYGGAAGSRKEEVDSQQQEENKGESARGYCGWVAGRPGVVGVQSYNTSWPRIMDSFD